jgi:hypothetical protein
MPPDLGLLATATRAVQLHRGGENADALASLSHM